jgi:transcriptional regulator with XRE-family HTH domain
MSYSPPIRTLHDLGSRIAQLRKSLRVTATAVAQKSGRSRDILYRLERGEDVAASSLLDILRALGYQLELAPARAPTLDEVRERFADDAE